MKCGMMEITVMYSCHSCNLSDVKLPIPARGQTEDLKKWMDQTIRLIAKDHHARSPMCMSRKMHDVKIPIDNAEWVGGPPIT